MSSMVIKQMHRNVRAFSIQRGGMKTVRTVVRKQLYHDMDGPYIRIESPVCVNSLLPNTLWK